MKNEKDVIPGCKHFTWKEALYLPSWDRLANDQDGLDDEIFKNLMDLFHRMEKIRDFFQAPINVHVSFRPQAYNAQIGGAKNSAHMSGMAVDFDVVGISCDVAKTKIEDAGLLETLGMRMEDNPPGSNWIHLDIRVPGPQGRIFSP